MEFTQRLGEEPKNEYVDFVCGTFDELKALFKEKNKQYGLVDPLANFATGAALTYGMRDYTKPDKYNLMYEEAKAYQRKHIAFINTHLIDAPKAAESLKDIAVYCIIQLYMIKKFNEAKAKEELKDQDGGVFRSDG